MICYLTIGNPKQNPGDLYLDVRPGVRELRRDDRFVTLSLRQYRLVQCLMANQGRDVDQWDIFYHVWGENSETGGPLVAQQCVHQVCYEVRKKLVTLGVTVTSVRKGYGYRIMEIEDVSVREERAAAEPRDGDAGNPAVGRQERVA